VEVALSWQFLVWEFLAGLAAVAEPGVGHVERRRMVVDRLQVREILVVARPCLILVREIMVVAWTWQLLALWEIILIEELCRRDELL
jgi:hypothetical protein